MPFKCYYTSCPSQQSDVIYRIPPSEIQRELHNPFGGNLKHVSLIAHIFQNSTHKIYYIEFLDGICFSYNMSRELIKYCIYMHCLDILGPGCCVRSATGYVGHAHIGLELAACSVHTASPCFCCLLLCTYGCSSFKFLLDNCQFYFKI